MYLDSECILRSVWVHLHSCTWVVKNALLWNCLCLFPNMYEAKQNCVFVVNEVTFDGTSGLLSTQSLCCSCLSTADANFQISLSLVPMFYSKAPTHHPFLHSVPNTVVAHRVCVSSVFKVTSAPPRWGHTAVLLGPFAYSLVLILPRSLRSFHVCDGQSLSAAEMDCCSVCHLHLLLLLHLK